LGAEAIRPWDAQAAQRGRFRQFAKLYGTFDFSTTATISQLFTPEQPYQVFTTYLSQQ